MNKFVAIFYLLMIIFPTTILAEVHKLSLSQLGFPNGVVSEENESTQNFFFPVPSTIKINNANLIIDFSGSELVIPPSNIRVFVNDIPVGSRSLVKKSDDDTGQYIKKIIFPLEKWAFASAFIKITLKITAMITGDPCVDERLQAGVIHIHPTSGIEFNIDDPLPSIKDYFLFLPARVKISLPASPISTKDFMASYHLSQILANQNHQVEFVQLPNVGDIVIGNTTALGIDSSLNENVRMAKINNKNTLLISTANSSDYHALQNSFISLLNSSSSTIFSQKTNYLPNKPNIILSMKELGLDTSPQETAFKKEWILNLNPSEIPAGFIPQTLILNVITTPSLSDRPNLFYVFYNGNLQHIQKLSNEGKSELFKVNLEGSFLSKTHQLRFLLIRPQIGGKCDMAIKNTKYPIQILPDTKIMLVRPRTSTETFIESSAEFQNGYDIFLEHDYLTNPIPALSALIATANSLDLLNAPVELKILKDKKTLDPTRAFILYGKNMYTDIKTPIHFDLGRVQIENSVGSVLVDISTLKKTNLLQMVTSSSHQIGLSIYPFEPSFVTTTTAFNLGTGNVFLYDEEKILLTFDSRSPHLINVLYPDNTSLWDIIKRYRLGLFTLLWGILTFVFIHLNKKIKHND